MSNKNIRLGKIEEALSKAVESGEFVKSQNQKGEMARLRSVFKTGTTRSVNIRLDEKVLTEIRVKAKASGMPYQTLIKTVLYQYANDKLSVGL
ncbi:hypothetical protein A3H26_03715 [candidate division WWE3 bacterium RIFCSPLOWO2_12_FULL_36_10]|uniref:Antitoxin n=1 Tax=candidate division WWE3 bacterium RIFCSPLOWO2_12_FULL_36_10 TaxID=1802630 RepID=A0A1F4VGA9_UNCKA|nr:MAG: hypothetical protein A3H26_03715 [candidate division WWE3 bacterium RIFCSPLOWO2_12_FULL_36_10]